jgi:glutamate racemase
VAATGLVPAIEANNFNAAKELLPQYLAPLIEAKISSLILGCTHYPLLKSEIRAIMGNIPVLSQDELIADSLKSYLERHPEYALKISKNSNKEFFVTQKNPNSIEVAKTFYNGEIDFSCIDLL